MSNVRNPVIVVQGGQWGSEAKGAIAGALSLSRRVNAAVRTGAINAGHTVYYNGKPYAMQQIPTAWVNPNVHLVIGPGAYVHPTTLFREIEMIQQATGMSVMNRLVIDYRCGVHDAMAEEASRGANRHHAIGATGKGCSEAIVAKIRLRNNGYKLFEQTDAARSYRLMGGKFADTVRMLNNMIDAGDTVLLEGTQGTALDMHLGPYPFTTSRMTSAANWAAEAGLSPALNYEVVLVVRTFPIRVAGNSGPMPQEIEWLHLACDINFKLETAGQPLLVSDESLRKFEDALHTAAMEAGRDGRYAIPLAEDGNTHNIHLSTWTPEERDTYRVAASELHRDALNLLDPATLADLKRLFEMTTVTKKLRRIARMDYDMLEEAVAINRPTWIALTFVDYLFPELRNIDASTLGSATYDEQHPLHAAVKGVYALTRQMQTRLGVPVRSVSFGPEPHHTISSAYLWGRGSER